MNLNVAQLLAVAPRPYNGPVLGRLIAAEYTRNYIQHSTTVATNTPALLESQITNRFLRGDFIIVKNYGTILSRESRVTVVKRDDAPEIHDALSQIWKQVGLTLACIGIIEGSTVKNGMVTLSIENGLSILFIERALIDKLSSEELYALLLHERSHAIANDSQTLLNSAHWQNWFVQYAGIFNAIVIGILSYFANQSEGGSLIKTGLAIGGILALIVPGIILNVIRNKAQIQIIETAADKKAHELLVRENAPHALPQALAALLREISAGRIEEETALIQEAEQAKVFIEQEYGTLLRNADLTHVTLDYLLNFSPTACIREAFPTTEAEYSLLLERIKKLS